MKLELPSCKNQLMKDMKGNAVNSGLKICSVLGYGEAVPQFGNLEDSVTPRMSAMKGVFFLLFNVFIFRSVKENALKCFNFKATETR